MARKEMGLKKYGTILQANNGRNALMDAYQECLDLIVYLRQHNEEAHRALAAYRVAIDLAISLREELSGNKNENKERDATPLPTATGVMLERLASCYPGAIFEHYKGPRYTVHAVARQHDTREFRIIYSGATQEPSDRLAFDQQEGFLQDVEWHGQRVPRFVKIPADKK